MNFKPFEELQFSDDFIFGKVMKDPKICAEVIECLLKIKVDHIVYPELQKEIKPYYTSKGIRFDVYVKDSDKIFDIEIQNHKYDELPKRMRYYQSILDVDDLLRGIDYPELKESYVIFICKGQPFDDSNLPVYDFKLTAQSSNSDTSPIILDDKAHRLVYNASAYEQELDPKLKNFLHFVCSNESDDDFTDRLADLVKSIKQQEANKTEYNNMNLHDRDIIREAKKEGRAEGARENAIETAKNMLKDNLPIEKISNYIGLSEEDIQNIVKDENPNGV